MRTIISSNYSPPSRWAVAKSVLQMASSKYQSASLFKFQPLLSSYSKYKFLVYPQPKLILEKALVHQHARCKKSNQLRKAHKEILVHTLDYRVWQAKGDTHCSCLQKWHIKCRCDIQNMPSLSDNPNTFLLGTSHPIVAIASSGIWWLAYSVPHVPDHLPTKTISL